MFTYIQNRCPFVLFVVFWCAVTMLTLEDKIFIVEQYALSKSVTAVRRSFRKRENWFHGKNLPSISTITNVVKTFELYGTVQDRRKNYTVSKEQYLSPTIIGAITYHHRQLSQRDLGFISGEVRRRFELCVERKGERLIL